MTALRTTLEQTGYLWAEIDAPEARNMLDSNEIRQSRFVVKMLAESLGVAEDLVRSLYMKSFADLKKNATVKDFLSIFAMRNVREILVTQRMKQRRK